MHNAEGHWGKREVRMGKRHTQEEEGDKRYSEEKADKSSLSKGGKRV